VTALAMSHTVGWVLVVAVIVIVVAGLARMVWRLLRGDTELESGGSMGHQLTDPLKDPTPADVE